MAKTSAVLAPKKAKRPLPMDSEDGRFSFAYYAIAAEVAKALNVARLTRVTFRLLRSSKTERLMPGRILQTLCWT